MTIISSQRHTDDQIVEAKRAAADYTVTVGKAILIDGETYRVVIDGHHSLAAARADGVEPVIVEATINNCDREAITDIDEYLESHWIDSDWYDIATGQTVWA
jgi:hypothetical protein